MNNIMFDYSIDLPNIINYTIHIDSKTNYREKAYEIQKQIDNYRIDYVPKDYGNILYNQLIREAVLSTARVPNGQSLPNNSYGWGILHTENASEYNPEILDTKWSSFSIKNISTKFTESGYERKDINFKDLFDNNFRIWYFNTNTGYEEIYLNEKIIDNRTYFIYNNTDKKRILYKQSDLVIDKFLQKAYLPSGWTMFNSHKNSKFTDIYYLDDDDLIFKYENQTYEKVDINSEAIINKLYWIKKSYQ